MLRHRRQTGFTLIELMVTVAIVAILSAIAYPSYRNYVIRGQLVNATNGLSALRANMERFYQDNRTYVVAGASPCLTAQLVGNFLLNCAPGAGQPGLTSYTLQAVGGQNGDNNTSGFTYFVDNLNVMSTTVAATAPSGWSSCATGWVTKQGGC